jgi:hypothetical protein
MVNPEVSNPADLISQKEKREVLRDDRLARNTYFAHANDVELELGGRFAKLIPTRVTGTGPTMGYPKQPEGSPWACDPVGTEPPLAYDVNEIEPVGEPHERTRPAASPVTAAARFRMRI